MVAPVGFSCPLLGLYITFNLVWSIVPKFWSVLFQVILRNGSPVLEVYTPHSLVGEYGIITLSMYRHRVYSIPSRKFISASPPSSVKIDSYRVSPIELVITSRA